jgi:hypothetical protein
MGFGLLSFKYFVFSLRDRRFRKGITMGEIISAPIHIDTGAHTVSCTMCTGSSDEVKEGVQICACLYFPSGLSWNIVG